MFAIFPWRIDPLLRGGFLDAEGGSHFAHRSILEEAEHDGIALVLA